MTGGDRAAAAARGVVGTRFRLHGRDAAGLDCAGLDCVGLDCVGVVAVALRAAGYVGEIPDGYRLRTGIVRFDFVGAGLVAADGAMPGDVLLCRVGPGQLHFAIRTAAGFVHADASLRRVVERPGALPWPLISAWRLP